MNKEVIEKLEDYQLIDMIDLARSYERKEELDYSEMIELIANLHQDENAKRYVGAYLPQFKRQIHREIERRFKKLINY